MYSSFSSDDSDDSDDALGTGLSLEPSSHHTALTVKSEPCEQGDGLAEGKPLNGVLLQGKGKIHTYIYVTHILLHMHTITNVIQLLVEDVVHAHLYHVMFLLSLLNSTDQKADKTSLYNFSKLKKNRKWLKVFL